LKLSISRLLFSAKADAGDEPALGVGGPHGALVPRPRIEGRQRQDPRASVEATRRKAAGAFAGRKLALGGCATLIRRCGSAELARGHSRGGMEQRPKARWALSGAG